MTGKTNAVPSPKIADSFDTTYRNAYINTNNSNGTLSTSFAVTKGKVYTIMMHVEMGNVSIPSPSVSGATVVIPFQRYNAANGRPAAGIKLQATGSTISLTWAFGRNISNLFTAICI